MNRKQSLVRAVVVACALLVALSAVCGAAPDKKDGAYRFPALSTGVDYEVYAQYNARKSDTKSVSQFDDRSQVYLNLKIAAK